MLLTLSSGISEIDRMAPEKWGIPIAELMMRAGKAVAGAVRARVARGGSVIILAGKGNNGGDGYAAACELLGDYAVSVIDVFGAGQRTEEGRSFLCDFADRGGEIIRFSDIGESEAMIKGADCIVDAIFGTGFCGSIPDDVAAIATWINETVAAVKIAVDVPIGIDADTGNINTTYACSMNATVVLSMIKLGLVSYPARSFVGEIVYDDLGLPIDSIAEQMKFNYIYVEGVEAARMLPKRAANSNKGSFGRALIITGSQRYRGAAHLSLEAALRGGAGYVTYAGTEPLCEMLCMKYPEAIYRPIKYEGDEIAADEIPAVCELSAASGATLVGCGSSDTDGLCDLVLSLLGSDGGALILDADAINAMARRRDEALVALKNTRRTVILTPHPLEFSRLSGDTVSDVQLHRIEAAVKFAAENRCIMVLKGAGTIVTDGTLVCINSSGSSALAKAGSGDVLAGAIASLAASGTDALCACAAAVYYHGAAADALSRSLSPFGVIPSDLPRAIGEQIAETIANK